MRYEHPISRHADGSLVYRGRTFRRGGIPPTDRDIAEAVAVIVWTMTDPEYGADEVTVLDCAVDLIVSAGYASRLSRADG